ncbi:aquaporin Z [Jongsikchunia kroppenstedtii]|uniref:aquaporin Z n=1 Tax=Jongsikchunia kroppenstedtii TaxID=1121721 RepID=UPI0005BD168F
MVKLVPALAAELVGSFWLVFAGCGSAVFAAIQVATDKDNNSIPVGIGYVGVALAFGLSVLVMAYAVGGISGGHFNPAVSVGATLAGRLDPKLLIPYIVTQVIGGLIGGLAVFGIAKGKDGFEAKGHMAANGYGSHSPDGYGLGAVLAAEIVLTAIFVFVILAVTASSKLASAAPAAIGLTLTLIHLISIPISNTSVNPMRSTAVAFFNGNGAPGQLWLFWVAPIVGGIIAALVYQAIFNKAQAEEEVAAAA